MADGRRRVVSPYRICPVGAHVDHQGGRMLATAIDLATRFEFEVSDRVEVESRNFPGRVAFDPTEASDRVPPGGLPEWGRYVWAAFAVLRDRLPEKPRGLRGFVEGGLPGSGLSSSASLLLACFTAWSEANGIRVPDRDQVIDVVRAENEHIGVACGVLDPAAIVGSRRGSLLAIDSDRVAWEATPLGPAAPRTRFLIVSTGVERHLAATDFNRRVGECREAAALVAKRLGGPPADRLGDLDREALREILPEIPGAPGRRARHFVGECDRVAEAKEAWAEGRLVDFGAAMTASCRSSIDLYETGSEELIALQAIWERTDGVLGARFCGAGFGGSSLALVEADRCEDVAERVGRELEAAVPALAGRARTFVVESADGVGLR